MINFLGNTLFEDLKCSSESFDKHYHDTYTIGLTYKGFLKSYNLKQNFASYRYSCRINNPGEIHGGISQKWSHLNFYPKIELLVSIYEQIFLKRKMPIFEKHIIYDKMLFAKLDRFFRSISGSKNFLLIESNLIDALSYLILNYTSYAKNYCDTFDNKRIIKQTLDFIGDSIGDHITLDLLAKNCSLSKYHFLRVFKKEVGMTPHSFIINERINRANKLLQKGVSISEASLIVGFSDQSHFTRNFKKYFGYTPKKSNFIIYK